jgi:hypothetical protein
MDYQAYIGRLRKLADDIEKDPHFHAVVEFERSFSVSEFADLQLSIETHGIENVTVWNEFLRFYDAANGFLFQWLYEGDKTVTIKTASADIAMVQQIYLPEQLLASPKIKLFYDQKRPFDRISPDEQVAVMFTKGNDVPQLHYFADETGEFYPLRLGFHEYLETLLEARAMYGWQKFFIDDPNVTFTRKEAEAFRHSLQTLFPSANSALFRTRDE